MGSIVGAAGDRVGLASGPGPQEVGCVRAPPRSWPTSNRWRVPAACPPTGEGESPLGLCTHSRRADQARLRRLGDFDQESDAEARRADLPATMGHELARVSPSAGFGDRGHRLLHVDTWNLKRLHVLFFIELATRRIVWFGVTENPNQEWVSQQARNLTWELQEQGSQAKFLICDNDKKFPFAFEHVLAGEGMRVIRTPLQAPQANAYAERWVGSARRECLDWLIVGSG